MSNRPNCHLLLSLEIVHFEVKIIEKTPSCRIEIRFFREVKIAIKKPLFKGKVSKSLQEFPQLQKTFSCKLTNCAKNSNRWVPQIKTTNKPTS